MSKLLTILSLSFMFSIASVDANANHCGGGHKEIKDTKDTSTDEDSKEAKLVCAEANASAQLLK